MFSRDKKPDKQEKPRVEIRKIKKLKPEQVGNFASSKAASFFTTIGFLSMLVGAAVAVNMANSRVDSLNGKIKEMSAKVYDLRSDVDELKVHRTLSTQDIEKVVSSAADAGRAVAALQNNYSNLIVDTQSDDIKDNAVKLSKYFTEDSFDAKQPWFMVKSLSGHLKWSFMSTYSFTGRSMRVVWECLDSQGVMYAYALGTYDANTGKFSDVRYATTSEGGKALGATVKDNNKAKLDQIIKSIKEDPASKDDGGNKPDAKTLQDIARARAELRAKNEKKGGN